MRFWQLYNPDYESDYQHSYINGGLEHPFGLPGVKCDICHQTWGGGRILPFECPISLRNHKNIKASWPIKLEQHRALQQEVQNEFNKIGISCPPLRPGDSFQPCYLDVPSKPRADFLWASLHSLVVSERVKNLFETIKVEQVIFCPINLRKIGKRNARLPAPIPSTGEPEDLIEEVPMLAKTDSVGPYFELIVQAKAGYRPGYEPISVCSGCGRETLPESDKNCEMLESMWRGTDIFSANGMLHVTENLKLALQRMKVTNVQFQIFEAFS
jgi:hypothetical protein